MYADKHLQKRTRGQLDFTRANSIADDIRMSTFQWATAASTQLTFTSIIESVVTIISAQNNKLASYVSVSR